jgi:hypothetical protein
MFFLGIFTRRVSQRAALVGLLGGIGTISAVAALNYLATVGVVAHWTQIAWPWYALIGSSATFGCGIIASLLPGFLQGETHHDKRT